MLQHLKSSLKMQAGGQYDMPELQQLNVTRSDGAASHGHMFSLGNHMSASTPLLMSHAQHLNHLQQQQPILQQQHQHQQPPPQSQLHPHPSFQAPHHDHHPIINQQSNPPHEQLHIEQQNQQRNFLQQPMQQQQQLLGLLSDSAKVPAVASTGPSSSDLKLQMNPSGEEDDGLEDGERAAGGNRWPRQETLALIKIRSEMDSTFRDCALKGPLWEEVARKLSESGYCQRNGRKCKEKFENIYKYYKKTKDGRAGRQDGKHYRFFAELEALYGSGNNTRAIGGGGGGGGGENGIGSLKGGTEGGASFKDGTKEGVNDRLGVFFAERPLATLLDVSFSSETSEEDYDEVDVVDYTNNRKRKRKLWSKSMLLFEKLLKKFFEKQEELQRKYFEVLDRREQDRFIREEAWKRQETARLNREYDLRAQEHTLAVNRNAVLVAYMQKIAGENVQLPDVGLPFSNTDAQRMQEEQEKDQSDSNNRWPKPEVQALIRLRSELEPKFQDSGPKGSLWEEVAAGMTRIGYNRNGKRCKEKWENINKYFRKSKDSARKRSENSKTCQYFNQLDDLYRKGVLVAQSSKPLKIGDPIDEPPKKLGSSSNENTFQTTTNAAADVPNADVPAKEIETDGIDVMASSDDPKNVDPIGDMEKSRANDELSLAVDADNGITAASLALAFDSLHGNEMFSSMDNKSHKLEGLVKEILEMQHLSDFEGRNEQQDVTNQDTRQIRDFHAGPEKTLPSTIDENNIDSFNVT